MRAELPMSNRKSPLFACVFATLATPALAIGPDPEWHGAPKDPTVALGRRLFLREWTADDPKSRGGDGLGPVFNEKSCVACHGLGGPGGGGTNSRNVELLTALPLSVEKGKKTARGPLAAIHPALVESGSIVLHRFGLSPTYQEWRKAAKDFGTTPPAPRRTGVFGGFRGRDLKGDADTPPPPPPPKFRMVVSRRSAPALFGSGRIDAISEEAILAEERRQSRVFGDDGRGIVVKGRVSRLRDGRIGRFGWKGQVADLNEFVRTACANEMGLEVPGHHQVADPNGYGDRERPKLDMSEGDCRALVTYVRGLPSPVEKPNEFAEAGRIVFDRIRCAECHRPSLGGVEGVYTDLLLHDMGSGLSDSGVYYGTDEESTPGVPKSQEWKTPPLWGLAASGPFLHDGRAATISAAIQAHGGEAQASADAFGNLSHTHRGQLMSFLRSLQVAPASELGPTRLTRRERLAEGAEAAGAALHGGGG